MPDQNCNPMQWRRRYIKGSLYLIGRTLFLVKLPRRGTIADSLQVLYKKLGDSIHLRRGRRSAQRTQAPLLPKMCFVQSTSPCSLHAKVLLQTWRNMYQEVKVAVAP